MPAKLQRGAALLQRHSTAEQISRLCWDDLRVFLACADAQTIRSAGRKLQIDQGTVTRRVDRLEAALAVRLFNRVPEGLVLTDEGRVYLDWAKDIESAFNDLGRKRTLAEQSERATVTVAITEGLGSYWVMPKLVEFQREHPMITVNLLCAMESVDVLRLEADISVHFVRPKHEDLKVSKLGRLHLYPFASQRYISTYGSPTTTSDFKNHRFVQQVAPQLDDSAFASYFGYNAADLNIGVRTNASTAHLYAIEKGGGIGVLPTYAMAFGASVVPIDIDSRYSLDLWMTYHPDMKRQSAASAIILWLREIFHPSVHPWFGDEFMHPTDILGRISKKDASMLGKGFYAVDPDTTRFKR